MVPKDGAYEFQDEFGARYIGRSFLVKVTIAQKYLIVLIFVFLQEKKSKNFIKLDSTKLNEIMDRYVDEGIYPFLFARIEGDHGVIYEHSVVNKKILRYKCQC